jgi:hypothetical protein
MLTLKRRRETGVGILAEQLQQLLRVRVCTPLVRSAALRFTGCRCSRFPACRWHDVLQRYHIVQNLVQSRSLLLPFVHATLFNASSSNVSISVESWDALVELRPMLRSASCRMRSECSATVLPLPLETRMSRVDIIATSPAAMTGKSKICAVHYFLAMTRLVALQAPLTGMSCLGSKCGGVGAGGGGGWPSRAHACKTK